MDAPQQDLPDAAPPRPWRSGLLAGLVLAMADWTACGWARMPWELGAASLVAGVLAGLVAGGVASLLRRERIGPALVLAGAIALEGGSIASKELAGEARLGGFALGLALALAGAWRLAAWRRHASLDRASALGAIAALPSGAWLAASLDSSPWARIAACALPLVWHLVAQSRGRTLAWLALLATCAWAQRGPAAPDRRPPPAHEAPARADGPSVVLLVIDTLRADALDPEGNLAAFGREGVTFRQCVSAAPWTLPSVSSLLTGLLPSQHGAVDTLTPLSEDVDTLAERLHSHGYATGAFTGGAFVGPGHKLDQGFEHFDATCERRFAPFVGREPLVWRLAKNRYVPLRALVRWVDEYVGLRGGLAAARAWAERTPGPKFLFLHTYEVHDYYLYDGDLDDEVRATHSPPSARFEGRFSVPPSELASASQQDLDWFRALYEHRIRAVESLFPELVAQLSPLVGEDAVWIVTADHGEGFEAATGRVHHGGRLHEDLLRVPLFMRAPGRLEPGRVIEEAVRTIDVLPTVLDLLGIVPPPDLAGQSLLPALRGTSPFPGTAFAEERAHGYGLLALRGGGWKWILAPGHEELYRLEPDPLEHHPLPGPPPDALRAEREAFEERYPPRANPAIELDQATSQHLRDLGYAH